MRIRECTMKKSLLAAAVIVLGGAANPASAELFTDPSAKSAAGKFRGSAYFGTSTVEYKNKDTAIKGDVDRTFLGISGAFGINDAVDAYASFALITKAETEDYPGDDTGTAIAFGIKGVLPIQGDVKLHGYAQYLMIDEDYGSAYFSTLSAEETLISLGVVAAKEVENITLYGGAELALSSDAEGTQNFTTGGTRKYDVERNDMLGVRAGARINAGQVDIDIGLALVHETNFTIGVSKSF